MGRSYTPFVNMDAQQVCFAMGQDRNGKPVVAIVYGELACDVALVTPACVTNWPRCTGDGNFGTMWGPTDITKTKFTLDLNDASINSVENVLFSDLSTLLTAIDDKLLDFVFANQLKLLGRKNLSRDEVKMLQIRTVRQKIDKVTGHNNGRTLQLSAAKYVWDGMGRKMVKPVNICDRAGQVLSGGTVSPGDVVAATMYANMVYTGVGGDKFGIHWSFDAVSIICQRSKLEQDTEVSAFQDAGPCYSFAQDYTTPTPCVSTGDASMPEAVLSQF
jgi:hypothetical protein